MSFDFVAPFYRTLETIVFGSALQRARTALLSQLAHSRRALLAGEGNGRCLAELRRIHPTLAIDCVDSSRAMLALAEKTKGACFIHADVREWESEARYDAIVTNFLLDCFDESELERVIANLAAAAEPRARWLIAEFKIPEAVVTRVFARGLIGIMYAFFRATTRISAKRLIDYRALLIAQGFTCIERQRFCFGMVTAECWSR